MAWSLQRAFNNAGNGANAAGVCEAAVCLWLKHIQDRVGKRNWGSSAGDYLPTTQQADALYQQFDNGAYLFRFASYLEQQVYPRWLPTTGWETPITRKPSASPSTTTATTPTVPALKPGRTSWKT